MINKTATAHWTGSLKEGREAIVLIEQHHGIHAGPIHVSHHVVQDLMRASDGSVLIGFNEEHTTYRHGISRCKNATMLSA